MARPPEGPKALPSGNDLNGDDYDLLPREEVQRILGIGPHTFYKYRQQYSSFRTVKVGNRTKMRRGTLKKFLEEIEDEQAA